MPPSIRQALTLAEELQTVSDSWRLDGEVLLAHSLGKTREFLYTWPQQEIAADELECYRDALARRKAGEPIAYITGRRAFWDFELCVNPHVLIPRPETELLVELALELLAPLRGKPAQIVDLGTGSGAIAIALARADSSWQLTAVDISAEALNLAQDNARELGVENIEFRQGSWCDGLGRREYDMIVANPPYVAAGDPHLQQGDLPFEPTTAQVAADDGLGDLRAIIEQGKRYLKKDAWLLLEHGYDQQAEVIKILEREGYTKIEGQKDLAGMDRCIKARWIG